MSRRVVVLLLIALAAMGTAALFREGGWLHKV